ncbi:CTLH/CRA C-terminal to lish motif domain-containing protein [Hysterangium stoloniferum]|nr:CTLH/CRA C-terminal to lish motif domain-containing protein [Hysterangium stoloniferum]
MSANKLNVEGILLLEQPFAKVPYENLRKIFRTSQKHIERELTAVQNASIELTKIAAQGEYDANDAIKIIDSMIGRVETLKRKLSDLNENSSVPTHAILRKRLQHLHSLESMSGRDDPEFDRWAETRLDRWLVDWALRTGNTQTAKQIAKEKKIEALVDIELFTDIQRIEEALLQYRCTDALAWCSENKAALRKIKSTLEFDLRLQEYIELSRACKKEEAIVYSKKYLVSWYETHDTQIKQALALLVFPPNTVCPPYKRLYDMERWKNLSCAFRLAAYTLSTLPTEPLLYLAMYGGLAALKLPSCYPFSNGTPAPIKNVDCPTCDPECLGQLAHEVPWSHHVNSTIVCRISGKIMDADNMPMIFPNGYVYSREALEEMAAKQGGKVTCPRTGDTCQLSDLKKIYIS